MRLLLTIAFLLTVTPTAVLAVTTPTFPLCVNPQGSVKASYSEGTHGIVGQTGEYKGSDTVYTLSNSTLTQCFCNQNGDGIQTDWWKATELTQDEIKILKNEGWFYVPTGSIWGLEDAPYMAKNTNYRCIGSGGSSGQTQGTSNTTNAVGEVLGLASTGNSWFPFVSFITGIFFLSTGLYLRRKAA